MRTIITRGLAAVLSLSALSAMAADDPAGVHAKVTLSNLQYTLTDLNTRDLVKPSVKNQGSSVLLEASGFGPAVTSTLNATPFDAVNGAVLGPVGYFPVPTSGASKTGNSITAGVDLTRDQIFNLGTLPGLNQPYAAYGTRGTAESTTIWLLSAGTQLTVTGLANLDLSINTQALTQPASLTTPALALEGRGTYNIYFSANGLDQDRASGQLVVNLQSTARGPGANEVTSNSASQAFSLTFQNTGTQSLEVRLYSRLFTQGDVSRAGLVPEPGTYALMALGLGLMAWRVRAARQG